MTTDPLPPHNLVVTVHARTAVDFRQSDLTSHSGIHRACSQHDLGLLAANGVSDDQSCIEHVLRLGQRLYAGRNPTTHPRHPNDLVLQVGRQKKLTLEDRSYGETYAPGDGFTDGPRAQSRAVVSATGARLWIDDQTCQVMVMNLSETTDIVLQSQDDSAQVRLPCRPPHRADSLRPACAAIRSKQTQVTFINAGVPTSFWVTLSDAFFNLELEHVGTPAPGAEGPLTPSSPVSRTMTRRTTHVPIADLQPEARAKLKQTAAEHAQKAQQREKEASAKGTPQEREVWRALAAEQIKLGHEAADKEREAREVYNIALRVALCLPAHRALLHEFFDDPTVDQRIKKYQGERKDCPSTQALYEALETDGHKVPDEIHVLVPVGLDSTPKRPNGRYQTDKLTSSLFGEVPRNQRRGGRGLNNEELMKVAPNHLGITSEVLRAYLFPVPPTVKANELP